MSADNYVLVTGGAGYIGSHCCKALAAAGYVPVTFDNLSRGNREAVRWGPLEIGDLVDRRSLDDVIARYRPSAAIHFAALAYVGESVTDPAQYFRNNVSGSLVLLDALRAGDVKRLVFSSTCATYGVPDRLPLTEDLPQRPINPYGRSKLMVEMMIRDYAAAYGLAAVALRYFNAAGADPDGEVGENHDPETHLIPLAIAAAAGRAGRLQVFGDDYDTPDGTCVRDYIHVSDLADAHVRALRAIEAGHAGPAYNLGNGKGFSVLEVIDAVAQAVGRRPSIDMVGRREGDPPVLVADSSRATFELGWKPRHTDLGQIVDSAWRWHSKAWG